MTAYRNALDRFEDHKRFNDLNGATEEYLEAARLGHFNVVRAFIKIFGAEHVDAKPKWAAATALGLAMNKANYKLAEFLIDHGADVNALYFKQPMVTYFTDQWLHRHYTELRVVFLVEHGADVYRKDPDGACAYDMVSRENLPHFITFFENPTAQRDPFGGEIDEAFSACRDGYHKVVEKFVKKFGVEALERKSHWHKNALMLAIEHRRSLAAGILLDHGADVNVTDAKGNPVVQSYMNYAPVFLKTFLNRPEININAQNEKGNSFLMEAVERGHVDIVKVLLDKNPDMHIQNNKGQTIFTMANLCGAGKMGKTDMAQILFPYTDAYQKKRIKDIFEQGSARKIKLKKARFKAKVIRP